MCHCRRVPARAGVEEFQCLPLDIDDIIKKFGRAENLVVPSYECSSAQVTRGSSQADESELERLYPDIQTSD